MNKEADLLRVLRVVAMTNDERMELFSKGEQMDGEALWFLQNIDDVAPGLKKRRWVLQTPFKGIPGSVVVTRGEGDLATLEITELGRKALAESVS